MTLETLFLIVMAAGLVLPVVIVIAGLGYEVLSDASRGRQRMSQTAISRMMLRHEKKSFFQRILMK